MYWTMARRSRLGHVPRQHRRPGQAVADHRRQIVVTGQLARGHAGELELHRLGGEIARRRPHAGGRGPAAIALFAVTGVAVVHVRRAAVVQGRGGDFDPAQLQRGLEARRAPQPPAAAAPAAPSQAAASAARRGDKARSRRGIGSQAVHPHEHQQPQRRRPCASRPSTAAARRGGGRGSAQARATGSQRAQAHQAHQRRARRERSSVRRTPTRKGRCRAARPRGEQRRARPST